MTITKPRTRWLPSGQLADVLEVDQDVILDAAGQSGDAGLVGNYRIVKQKMTFESGWGGYSWKRWRYQGQRVEEK